VGTHIVFTPSFWGGRITCLPWTAFCCISFLQLPALCTGLRLYILLDDCFTDMMWEGYRTDIRPSCEFILLAIWTWIMSLANLSTTAIGIVPPMLCLSSKYAWHLSLGTSKNRLKAIHQRWFQAFCYIPRLLIGPHGQTKQLYCTQYNMTAWRCLLR
jgi:hypothetical protein